MAGRFLIQRLSSRVSRSTSLIGAHSSAKAGAAMARTGPAAMYYNTSSCSPAAAKVTCTTTGMSSVTNRLKPALVNPLRGGKQPFSSNASTSREISKGGNSADWKVEWEAKRAAWEAEWSAKEADRAAKNDDFKKFMKKQGCMWGATASSFVIAAYFGEED